MRTICLLLLFVCAVNLNAAKHKNCFPDNNLRFSTNLKSLDQINEFEANQLIRRFKEALEPLVKKETSKEIKINLEWSNDRVNAHATKDDNDNPVIVMLGGMVRHPEMTKDGVLMILCHELGHHLGGAPRKLRGRSDKRSWSSAEGQADYFAVTKCLPRLFDQAIDTNILKEEGSKEFSLAQKNCSNEICTRTLMAGFAVTKVFASLKGSWSIPSFENQDPVEVFKTLYSHPNPQCRLDTFVAGVLCDAPRDRLFDMVDPKVGACVRKKIEAHVDGARPRCWYMPQKDFR